MTIGNVVLLTRQLASTVKALLARKSYETILKWNKDQPRNPAGSSMGGRWASSTAGVRPEVETGRGASARGRSLAQVDPKHISFSPPGTVPAYFKGVMSTVPGMGHSMGQANYRDIMNAPQGTGFGNKARFTGDTEMVQRLTPPPPLTGSPAVVKVLSEANIKEVVKDFGGGHANTALLVKLDDANETLAVLKPERGETWHGGFANSDISSYVTNTDFSLGEREAFAFEVSDAMKMTIVPETVHRTTLGLDALGQGSGSGGGSSSGGSGRYDSDQLREMYDSYRDKAQEDAMDAAGGEMADLYAEAQKEHVSDIENRVEEMRDIWNEMIEKEYPDVPNTPEDIAAAEALRAHPVLPMGSLAAFERKDPPVLDPLEVLDEAKVDPSSAMSDFEKDDVKAIFRKQLDQGHASLGELDEDAAKDHLDRDKWYEDHQDTEMRLIDSKIKGFESWKQQMGYGTQSSSSSGGSIGTKNSDAPHPDGGSLQKFVSDLDDWGSLSHTEEVQFAVLDYAIGTMDRHGHNIQYDPDGHGVAIDNGYSMPDARSFSFRSNPVGDWLSSSNTDLSESERKAYTEVLSDEAKWKALVDRHPSMSSGERLAFLGRLGHLKNAMKTEDGLYQLWKGADRM